jgi:hypothetical protein
MWTRPGPWRGYQLGIQCNGKNRVDGYMMDTSWMHHGYTMIYTDKYIDYSDDCISVFI